MAQMLRKQIYIRKQQEVQLKRLAKARGVSEAEIIREAIDRELSGGNAQRPVGDSSALEKVIRFALSRREHGVTGEPYKWNRDGLYEERMSRYDRRLGRD